MNSVTTMVILGIVPFNLIKYGISCLITSLPCKKISPMIHLIRKSSVSEEKKMTFEEGAALLFHKLRSKIMHLAPALMITSWCVM